MRARLNGTIIDYRDEGRSSGPPVTLIGGIGNDMSFWEPQLDVLTEHYRVVRFDMRGHGGSDAPLPPYGFDLCNDDILRLWEHLGIQRSAVIGFGMSGAVALRFAALHPDRVTAVVGAGCRATMDEALRNAWLDRAALVEANGISAIVEATLERWLPTEKAVVDRSRLEFLRAMLERTTALGYAAWARAFATVEISALLPGIAAPTLLITGEHDIWGGNPALVATMASTIPDAVRVLVPDAGHLCNIEHPSFFNAAMTDFLGQALS